jgi:hypothetical protein
VWPLLERQGVSVKEQEVKGSVEWGGAWRGPKLGRWGVRVLGFDRVGRSWGGATPYSDGGRIDRDATWADSLMGGVKYGMGEEETAREPQLND